MNGRFVADPFVNRHRTYQGSIWTPGATSSTVNPDVKGATEVTLQDPPESIPGRLGYMIYRISRGAAVAVLSLALYVGLTNWEGSGSVWFWRYAGIALAIYLVGMAVRYILGRIQ